MKNKLLPVLLAGVLAFALTACGGGDTAAEEETAASQPASETASEVSEPSEVIPGEIVDEDGNYLEGFTSGTDTYEFITYSKPLADKESDEDGSKTYTIYIGEEGSDEEETMFISFNYADFTSDGLEIGRDDMKAVLEKDGVKESDMKELSIDGADALQHTKQSGGHETVTTSVFYGGNYIDISLYSLDADPSDFARQIYNEVISKITISR